MNVAVGGSNHGSNGRLRVVVWNVAHRSGAWAALDRLDADICLLNEAIVPEGRIGVWSSIGTLGRDGKKRRWTAAVVSKHPTQVITGARAQWRGRVREVPFVCSRPGAWVAAQVETPVGLITAVSLYGLLDEFSDASVHRSLSELSPLMHDPRYRAHLVLGGDLNTGTQWPSHEELFNARDKGVLDRITSHGLSDCVLAKRPPGRLAGCPCLAGDSCTHVRTQRRAQQPAVPFQTDYLFASAKVGGALVSCEVLANDEWFAFSDHAPIVADFSL